MKKSTIIIVAVVIIAAIAYFYVTGGTTTGGTSLLQQQANQEGLAAGAQVLGLLEQIQSLRIDTGLFADPAYLTLQDYSVPIPTVGVGRPNPFAPIPGVSNTIIPSR